MIDRPIKWWVMGDVHMGHSSTPAVKIAEEIRHYLAYNKEAHTVDILVIEGDYWDKLLPNNHDDVFITEENIYYILNWCKDHDVTLLLVDGTPLHDAGQMQKFIHINDNAKINANLVFVEDVSIRYIPKFDINVLFIPDRPRSSPEATYQTVLKLMQEMQLEYIDVAIMHGAFQYQVPQIAPEHKHIEENYLSIVKGPIFIGHIHTHSVFDRIIAAGSFSRLKHGEEEAKGFIEAIVQPNLEFKAKFIENKLATIYKSIIVTGLDIQDSITKIRNNLEGLPINSKIRIVCEQNHPLTADKSFTTLKIEFNNFYWSIKVITDKSVVAEEKEVFSEENSYTPLVINKNNIEELLLQRASDVGYDAKIISAIPKLLKEII